jgi:hypothetical protein
MTTPTVPTEEDYRNFAHHGAIVKPGLLAPTAIDSARRHVERWLNEAFDPRQLGRYTQTTFAPELESHPDLLRLYTSSPARSLAEALIHPHTFRDVRKAQVQVRLPNRRTAAPQPTKAMHVDGVACPHLDPRELRTFTLLVGILLTPVPDTASGALRFVRGGHLLMAEWFRTTWRPGTPEQTPSDIADRDSEPFLGEPGDVILMHHAVPHAVGANEARRPRIALYFRLEHEAHHEHLLDALRDPWLEYPRLRRFQ